MGSGLVEEERELFERPGVDFEKFAYRHELSGLRMISVHGWRVAVRTGARNPKVLKRLVAGIHDLVKDRVEFGVLGEEADGAKLALRVAVCDGDAALDGVRKARKQTI
jgi:hypothetical protein